MIGHSAAKRGSSNGGFLLVEALATMAISAFLLVALASSVSLLLRASERSNRIGQEIEETSRTVDALAREIARIAPYRFAGRNAGFVFSGTSRLLVFGREASRPGGGAEARTVAFASQSGSTTNRLLRAEAPLLPGDVGPAMVPENGAQEFYRGRFAIRFAYFGGLDDGRETLSDTWERPDALPVAIRIAMVDPSGNVRSSLRVPLLVDAEPGCAAPGKAVCRAFAVESESGESENPEPEIDEPIDADDPLGWSRYLR